MLFRSTAGSVETYTDLALKDLIDTGKMAGPRMNVTGPFGASRNFLSQKWTMKKLAMMNAARIRHVGPFEAIRPPALRRICCADDSAIPQKIKDVLTLFSFERTIVTRGNVTVACQPHKLDVVGAIPAPATCYSFRFERHGSFSTENALYLDRKSVV